MSVDGYLMVPPSFTTQPSSGRKGKIMIAGRGKSRLKNKKKIIERFKNRPYSIKLEACFGNQIIYIELFCTIRYNTKISQ